VTGVRARGQLLAGRAAAWYSALPPRRKEVAQDSALALTLAVLNLMSLLPYQSQMHPAWLALFLVSVQCLPLAIRRLWPVPAAILCGIPRNLYDALGFGFAPLPLANAIAFATIAERSRWWIRWPTVCFTAVGIAYGQTTPGHTDEPYDAIVQVFIFGAAWGVGMLSRARRDSMAAVARRAERAEAELAAAASRAAAAERLRIARELHDVVAHHVSLIAVQAEAVGALLPSRPVEAARSADLIAATARQAMTELRRLLGVLRFRSSDPSDPSHPSDPSGQDQHQSEERSRLTPAPSITRLDEVFAFVREAGLLVDSDVCGSPTVLSPGVDLTAYRIVQEALTNALRHAPGSTACVNVAYEADCVTVRPRSVRRLRRHGPIAADVTLPPSSVPPQPSAPPPSSAPPPVSPLRVLVADDQELVRAGFCVILEAAGFCVAGEAADGVAAVTMAVSAQPDVVLMDIRMPVMDGLEATRRILADGAGAPKVVILTTFDLDDYVYEALRAGASGFLLKDAPRADLISAVRVAAAGDALLAPSVTRRLIEAFARRPASAAPAPSRLASLTRRERDILRLIARGNSNMEIARELVVSEATVKTHVGHLLAKLDLRDRVQAVILAYETGAVTPGRAD